MATGGAALGQEYGMDRVVYLNGEPFNLPEEQDEYDEFKESLERENLPIQEREARPEEAEQLAGIDALFADLGITPGVIQLDVATILLDAGIDPAHPDLQPLINNIQDRLNDPDSQAAAQADLQQAMLALAQNPEYAAPEATAFDQALAQSGFTGGFQESQFSEGGLATGAGQQALAQVQAKTKFETSDEGWTRHRNGTLIDPAGTVYVDPTGNAPGSLAWQRGVLDWAPAKIEQWKKRLVEAGFLTKEAGKNKKVDQTFLGALTSYHESRYIYGKPVPPDAAAGGSSVPKVKPVDLEEMQASIRNTVRAEYERVFGTSPSDGEVKSWSQFIMNTGMELQRSAIKKYDNPNTAGSVAEATERFSERLSKTPEAEFITESVQENTRLRDTFERMAQVTNSLVD